jgi:hypothetical protein
MEVAAAAATSGSKLGLDGQCFQHAYRESAHPTRVRLALVYHFAPLRAFSPLNPIRRTQSRLCEIISYSDLCELCVLRESLLPPRVVAASEAIAMLPACLQ